MQITLSTTMTCAGCLKKLQPLLDGEPMIDSWESNLKDPRKLLVCRPNTQVPTVYIPTTVPRGSVRRWAFGLC